MIDALPCATPMPVPPMASVTSTQAPSPPAVPLPVFVPPSVTDPVSNLDFLPVDDAFALEFRSETIEQLVGSDALRRGESERIEAGRSHTNADLVAGRDRVRVHGALHEHTGHALAEQAAHIHTTVDDVLGVHAGSEDTVLLAGHMRDLWDGGTAIVAAMTDDTVAGGGIRVTTPLDLWVHGLMGVEERIGTCTADAVLMELGATHYEREYGPGVHVAGLAVYTGSLYQSSRSSFRPLMRVSSGVRNLIAAGDGGGGGGGAGNAPGASPPPAPAAGGAGTDAASETVSAATGAGGTAQAAGMAGVCSEDLTGIHRSGEVAALARGANVAAASGDLTELRRGTDTAGQLAALRDAMRGAGADAEREVGSASRVSVLDDTASVHEACAPNIVAHIPSEATVLGMDAPELHSAVSPRQPPPWVKLGLLGGADRPSQPAAPAHTTIQSDWIPAYRQLRTLHRDFRHIGGDAVHADILAAADRITLAVVSRFERLGGNPEHLHSRPGVSKTERAYRAIEEMSRRARKSRDLARSDEIRKALETINEFATSVLAGLTTKYGTLDDLFIQPSQTMGRPPMQLPPATVVPTWPGAPPAPIGPPVRVPPTTVATPGRLDIPVPEHPIAPGVHPAFPEPVGGLVHATGVPGPPPASSLPEPLRSEAGGLERARLDQPATTAEQPTTTDATFTPSLAGPSLFWLQPADPVPAPGPVRFDPGLHHAGQTTQPPPVTTTPLDVDLTVERALLAGRLPPGFNPIRLIDEARTLAELGLAEELAAGRLPLQTIDLLMDGYRATDEEGSNAPYIERLRSLKERIEHVLRDAYPGRTNPQWLDDVQILLRSPGGLAPGRTGAGAGAPPTTAYPGRSRAPGMSGGPHPVGVDAWSAPPGPSNRVVYTEAMRTPVMSTGAPPGWQGAEMPGFARADSGAVELPFSRREEIAIRFRTADAVLDALHALQTGGADTLGWSATRWRPMLEDLHRLYDATKESGSEAAATLVGIDWSAIEALLSILHVPPPSP